MEEVLRPGDVFGAPWAMAKVPQTVTSEVWGVPWERMHYPEGPWEVWDGFAWY